MGNTSGIGGTSGPSDASGLGKELEKMPGGKDAMTAKVQTLGELKSVLEKNLGHEKGDKIYNMFLQSFALMMLQQIQQSAQHAQQAAKQMRMDSGLS